jgi:hypothetical protein
MFAAVPLIVRVEVAVRAEKVAVPENAGAFENTRRPVPVSSVSEFKSAAESAVVVARDEESKNNPRDAVNPEKVVRPESVAADIAGEVSVLLVRVCVPPTVTTDAALVPAVVTRRSPVDIVRIPDEWVRIALPFPKLTKAPVAKNRSENEVAAAPSAALSFAVGSKLVPTVAVLRIGEVSVLLVSVCVPPTVTTDAALVPAVVTRRSPVETVRIPDECVITLLPFAKSIKAPDAK